MNNVPEWALGLIFIGGTVALTLGTKILVRRYLGEALDAVSDGMPADFVAMTLYAALGALREGGAKAELN